ncbi:peroxidase P7 [Selaginella moellendorffii]|nr:peroxidase P7 [Selaginella moellendorffii]|eukprot:XP_002992167.2 peroxidase P7 [Selaginella moellendorffii]
MAIMSFVLVLLLALHGSALGQTLSSSFYRSSCPNLTTIVRAAVQQAVQAEARIAASFVRLHFHDCFVNGCDASILLDGANLEQNAFPNAGSARGFDIVDSIKSSVESSCPGVVSCADLLALIARDSVVALNGPSWTVVFGRRDSLTASQSAANSNLPPPTLNASALIASFQNQGLSTRDMVALSGAHTIGQAQCTTFKARLYGPFQRGDQMDQSFNTSLQSSCPSSNGDTNLSPLDVQTPTSFDNRYFRNLQNRRGLLFSDQTLFSGGQASTRNLVNSYALSQSTFFQDFGNAMVRMGNINVLTGSNGEIRRNCGRTN